MHQPLLIAGPLGQARRLEQRLSEVGDPCLALGHAEAQLEVDDEVGPPLGPVVEQLDRLIEVPDGVERSERLESRLGRLARVRDGLLDVDLLGGVEPVMGQLADALPGPPTAELFERLGDLPVGAGPAGHPHLLVEGVLDEGVAEAVGARGVAHLADERHAGGPVQHVDQVVLVHLRGQAQVLEVELPPDDRGQAQDAGRLLAQAGHSSRDHLPHARREARLRQLLGEPVAGVVLLDRSGLGQVPPHLAHEERVAVRLRVYGVRQLHALVREIVTRRRLHELHDLQIVQALQDDPMDPRLAAEGRQGLEQRVRRGELGVAVGADDE